MNILGLTLAFLLLTSWKEPKTKAFDLNSLPNNWVKLTEKDGKLVVFNSCDDGNLLLTISNNRDHFELFLHGQQEDYDFEILESTQLKDTIYLKTKWKESSEKQDFKFFWADKQKGLGRFITTYSSGFTSDNLFVTGDKQTNFEKFDQPCRECWGDECDKMEIVKDHLENPIKVINKVFNDFVKYQESTDSRENIDLMTKNLESLNKVTDPNDLDILINVWMYYDPTDFPSRDLVFKVLHKSRPESIKAIKTRINNRKDWESDNTAPYSELNELLMQMTKIKTNKN